jgi:ATP phosphoribosyltransferase regulatory subunit
MALNLPALRPDEAAALNLRALYEESGYRLYRMSSFEEYDLYMQNRPFLNGADIITFTSADGRLMALKPDVTLSIVKNTPAGETRRIYYLEKVFRRGRQSGEYREINQMGLEFIGGEGPASEAEVVRLAARSLAAVGSSALDLSHMEFIEAMLSPLDGSAPGGDFRRAALAALRDKSPHLMREAALSSGLDASAADRLARLAALSGPFPEALAMARAAAEGIPGAQRPLDELEQLFRAVGGADCPVPLGLDFSILNDADYYNGLIFQGFVEGSPRSALSGGRYDNLLRRFGKTQGAIGFAIYIDDLCRARPAGSEASGAEPRDGFLNIALPKGRLGSEVCRLFERAGLACGAVNGETRRLIFEDPANMVRYFLVKPADVDIYVERGAADIGVVGRDVLLESGADVLELLDLGLGGCRFAVASRPGFAEDPALPLRVATKYPSFARRYYSSRSRSVEIIKLQGSIELAPLLELSDVIVDIVESGATIRENNLAVLSDIEQSSARLIANRASWRFKKPVIENLLERLGSVL